MGKLIVISGQSASGKTTLINRMKEEYSVAVTPRSTTFGDPAITFPEISPSLRETYQKQNYYFSLDCQASETAQTNREAHGLVFSDRDFMSALAHNYAIHRMRPEISVYPWMVHKYTQALKSGKLKQPDLHVFLDVSPEERKRRCQFDIDRKRDDCFFDPVFSSHIQSFYKRTLASSNSLWLDYENFMSSDEFIKAVITKAQTPQKDTAELINSLKATVNDKAIRPIPRQHLLRG